ncbi:MAG: Proline-tRNA ligase [Candidatus Woesebacteria bacterium GW2011_GWC1_42_9]|nr:MAG: Proline-tRNA ligase [Candidatus Woesebacteria bacterium GW2011_GWC1_42_9]
MKQSELFPKTRKTAPKGAESINHQLLVRAGFMDQLMAGSWTLLPLGFRVVSKINQIIREEMNAIGGQEMLMPLLHPKSIWNETERWDKASEIMYKLKDPRGKEYVLSFTHEEIVMDLIRKNINSYQDLPLAVYHFSTKFRNEPRAKSGILRGREFMMKDLYSTHATEKDLYSYYEKVKQAYSKIFKRIGFDFRITEAAGGVFTDRNTHEFQVIAENGEDTIYFCQNCEWGSNKEIFKGKEGDICPSCKSGKVKISRGIEVGNIFPLGKWYAEKMGVNFTDKDGSLKPVWFGSYGIGSTRVMGAAVEVSNEDKGIIWFDAIKPFDVHLVELTGAKKTAEIYKTLIENKIDVLWDDRELGAGEKFADSDLIGIPIRLVVSEKTGSELEWKLRSSDKLKLMAIDEVINKLKAR